jgi:hypothetical protein
MGAGAWTVATHHNGIPEWLEGEGGSSSSMRMGVKKVRQIGFERLRTRNGT